MISVTNAVDEHAMTDTDDLVARLHLGKHAITTREIGDIPGCIPAPYDPTLLDLQDKTEWRPGMSRAAIAALRARSRTTEGK